MGGQDVQRGVGQRQAAGQQAGERVQIGGGADIDVGHLQIDVFGAERGLPHLHRGAGRGHEIQAAAALDHRARAHIDGGALRYVGIGGEHDLRVGYAQQRRGGAGAVGTEIISLRRTIGGMRHQRGAQRRQRAAAADVDFAAGIGGQHHIAGAQIGALLHHHRGADAANAHQIGFGRVEAQHAADHQPRQIQRRQHGGIDPYGG